MKKEIYVIGEIGLCHNGSIEVAHQLIDKAHEAKIDAVKFQKRTVSLLATKEELNRKDDRFPFLGQTYGEIRESLEFTKNEFLELKEHAKNLDLDFIITPFDDVALEFIIEIGIDAIKLASHSLTNLPLLEKVSRHKLPVIFSTGMSTYQDIETAISILTSQGNKDLAVLHCVSSYPTPDKECQLHFIKKLKEKFKLKTGYSGHEIGYLPSLLACAEGAEIIERHITLNNDMEGFDHRVALNPDDLKEFTLKVRQYEKIYGNDSLDREITDIEATTQKKYHVSAVSIRNIEKGKILEESDIIYKNPGTGIAPKNINTIIGRKTKIDIPEDSLLTNDMFE